MCVVERVERSYDLPALNGQVKTTRKNSTVSLHKPKRCYSQNDGNKPQIRLIYCVYKKFHVGLLPNALLLVLCLYDNHILSNC